MNTLCERVLRREVSVFYLQPVHHKTLPLPDKSMHTMENAKGNLIFAELGREQCVIPRLVPLCPIGPPARPKRRRHQARFALLDNFRNSFAPQLWWGLGTRHPNKSYFSLRRCPEIRTGIVGHLVARKDHTLL
jgi:hypothetical protein